MMEIICIEILNKKSYQNIFRFDIIKMELIKIKTLLW